MQYSDIPFSEKLKFYIKNIFAFLVYYSGILFLYRKFKLKNKAVVLLYHGFYDPVNPRLDYSPDGMYVSPEVFKKHMKFLARFYNVLSCEDMVGYLKSSLPLPKNTCVITFDDGLKSVYDFAFPVLKTYNLTCSVYLTTNFIENGPWFWEERLKFLLAELFTYYSKNSAEKSKQFIDVLNKIGMLDIWQVKYRQFGVYIMKKVKALRNHPNKEITEYINILEMEIKSLNITSQRLYLNWSEIQEMMEGGLDFGGHTTSHCNLASIEERELQKEISDNKNYIEKNCGKKVTGFAYPFGRYDDRALSFVKNSSYSFALSTHNGFVSKNSDLYLINRVNIHELIGINTAMFACRITRFLNNF
jgi:peptidoglycan/xylan/chitin deacetylase (PgdA/CDA1 family)